MFTFTDMTDCAPQGRLFLILLLTFCFAGCSQFKRSSLDEEKEPHFIEGTKRVKGMDWEGAIQSFERALQSNPNNASAHLELGVLYDTKKNDFASAIYHYHRHLLLQTNSPMADVVKQNITACTRELAKTVQFTVLARDVQRDLERLDQTNSILKGRVQFLEAELNRRPQFITNYVTNFVGVPQFDTRGSARLTQPTEPLPRLLETDKTEPQPPVLERRETVRTAPRANPVKTTPAPIRRSPPVAEARVPSPAAAGGRAVHTVRPGETLASLASRYGVTLQALRSVNPGAARGVRAGQKITIPK